MDMHGTIESWVGRSFWEVAVKSLWLSDKSQGSICGENDPLIKIEWLEEHSGEGVEVVSLCTFED